MNRIETIGNCKLFLGDCREILPTLGKVDAVVTDPPYGIGYDKLAHKMSGVKASGAATKKSHYELTDWDDKPIELDFIIQIINKAHNSIIFGGNYYALPASRCWLIWDKENGINTFADAEMAWTNIQGSVRLKRHMWNGMLRKNGEERHGHPTQKPVEVMQWCIEQLPKNAQTILDPFMGSGTTGVACVNLGRSFIGIEREERYFDIACKRIETAYKQPRLFDEPPQPKPTQGAFL